MVNFREGFDDRGGNQTAHRNRRESCGKAWKYSRGRHEVTLSAPVSDPQAGLTPQTLEPASPCRADSWRTYLQPEPSFLHEAASLRRKGQANHDFVYLECRRRPKATVLSETENLAR